MTGCRLTGLNRFLWIVLLLLGIASRLHAQESPTPAAARRQTELGKLLSLPEITGEASATSELQAPTLDHLLKQLEDYRQAHMPFHIQHREVIKVRNASEAKTMESMGFAPGRLFETEFESAFWDNRSWKRCLGHGVDGEQASDKHLGGDRAGTAGRDVPLPLLGVFVEPKPAESRLSFDGIYPLITFAGREQQGQFEIWMLPVSGQWIPKQFRLTLKDEDDPIIEWEVKHIKAFGKDHPPQIIDGEGRTTYRDGEKETTITTEFVITKALYGDKVVPSDIDPSLAPMPATAVSDRAISAVPLESPAKTAFDAPAEPNPDSLIAVPDTPADGPTIEISADHPPKQQPTLEELLAQWDRFRKAYIPYHVQYRDTIRADSVREAKLLVKLGYPECRTFVNEIESAFWKDRSWRRPLAKWIDGKNVPTTIAPLKGAEYNDLPSALSGVFYQPFPKDCSLSFDGPYPHITVQGEFPGEKTEVWMMPAARWWFPLRMKQVFDGARHDDEIKDAVESEWEVKHFRLFGTSRAPQVVDGVTRTTYRDGDQQTTITTEFVITKALYGDKVVPGDIDPSLAPMPAPAAPSAANADQAAAGPATDSNVVNHGTSPPNASKNPRASEDGLADSVIVIDTAYSDIDRSEVIRDLVAALEKEGLCKRGKIDRSTKSSLRTAVLYHDPRTPLEKVIDLVRTLKSHRVQVMMIRDDRESGSSSIFVNCPASTSGDDVRTIREALAKHTNHVSDVFVAGGTAPAAGQSAATVATFKLKNTRAGDAARIVEQLFVKSQRDFGGILTSVAVDEGTNSVIVRGEGEKLREIESLLQRLDDASGADDYSPASPTSQALDFNNSSSKGIRDRLRDAAGIDPNVFSFYIGITDQSASELRQQYDALDQQAKSLSQRLREPLPDPATGEKLKSQLRDAVQQAFEARQKLQRAELAEFAKRLKRIHESIEMREKIRQQIIDRRVDELLDPDLKWDEPTSSKESASGGRAQALRSDSLLTSDAASPPDSSRRAADSKSPHMLDKTPDDLHELLTQQAEQIRQIRNQILRYETRIAEGQDVEDSRRSLSIAQKQLVECTRKQELDFEEYRRQIAVLQAAVDRDRSRLTIAEQARKDAERLHENGLTPARELRQRNLEEQNAKVTLQSSEAFLNLYQKAGEGLVPSNTASGTTSPPDGSRRDAATSADVSYKIQALIFDVDPKEFENIAPGEFHRPAPADFAKSFSDWARDGGATVHSRPQIMTRMNETREVIVGSLVEMPVLIPTGKAEKRQQVGLVLKITPREAQDALLTLDINITTSRVAPGSAAATTKPSTTPAIEANTVALRVPVTEFGGSGILLGPFPGEGNKRRCVHLVVTPTDDVAASPVPPVLQGSWQLQGFVITGNPNSSPFPEHPADGFKRLAPIVISGNQMIRTQVNGTKVIYTLQYDSTTTPHRLTTTTVTRDGQEHTQRFIMEVNPGFLRLGATTDGHHNFPKSFDEPRTVIQTFKRVQTEPAGKDAGAEENGSPSAPASGSAGVSGESHFNSAITGKSVGVVELVDRTQRKGGETVGKLVLVFFQDRSRRAVPCVVVKINNDYFAVTTAPATVVPDGTPHAVDRCFVEWGENPAIAVTYDDRSTKEFSLYRFPEVSDLPGSLTSLAQIGPDMERHLRGGFDPALEIGVLLTAMSADAPGSYSAKDVRIAAVNVCQKLTLPKLKVEHHYDALFAIDAALPEGTPLFLNSKLMGLTILGSRFVGEEARRSFVVPASRLWELCQDLTRSGKPVSQVRPSDPAPIPATDSISPQTVLDAIRRCQEEKNYPGFVALLSDAEAARMAGMMLQSAVSLSLINGLIEKSPNPDANPDSLEVQKIQAIVNRYTVDDPDLKAQDAFHQIAAIGERQMSVQIPGAQKSPVPLPDWNAEQYSLHLRTAARVVSDPRAFVEDMMKAMEEFNPAKAEPANVEWKLEVNGDQAIATSAMGSTHVGLLSPAPLQLKKVDGTWRITSLISDENLMKLINVPGSDE